MKKTIIKLIVLSVLSATVLTSCGEDNPGTEPETKTSKYVILTMSENTLTKPGYVTTFDAIPTGNVSNITSNSLQGTGMGGWRPYKNWLLKMFNSTGNELGIERLKVEGNTVKVDNFIKSGTINGSGNFTILDDTKGFYWDSGSPLKIQTFNPTSLSRTGEIDLEAAVNERVTGVDAIKFRSVGQKFLAVKNGKLYANITYANGTNAAQYGFWDDYFPDVYIAVIDIATAKYEKTIKIEDTGSIAYINDNEMYSFDTNGDLYIVTQGRSALGGKSKISRIKANETDIDKTWSINMNDINAGGKFVTVYATGGKLITTIPNTTLTGGGTGNINFSPIWEFYVIDVATKTRTRIEGVPAVTNPGAAYGTVKVDDKYYLRVNVPNAADATKAINGYYVLNSTFTSATQAFNVTEGGSISGFYKIEL